MVDVLIQQKVFLPPAEVALFIQFRENQDVFKLLKDAGVFNIKSGQAVLSFNADGVLTDIDINRKAFRR